MSSDDRTGVASRVDCTGCGAVLGPELVRGLAVSGPNGFYGEFDCPACGSRVTIPPEGR